MTKYHARTTQVDNIRFASQAEAMFYQQLKLRKRAKDIQDFTLQPEFVLLDKFKDNAGKTERAIKYVADFRIIHLDGSEEIIDVKGFKTKDYRIKAKLFKSRYPQYKFTEVSRP